MNQNELIRRFETNTLPEDSFHHADHVRLGFAYLSQYPPLEALDKFSAAPSSATPPPAASFSFITRRSRTLTSS